MRVVGDRVIVRTEDQDVTERPSGIVTVEVHLPHVVGEVIACAENPDVKAGDVVIFAPSAGQHLDWDGPCLVLEREEILAVYEGVSV